MTRENDRGRRGAGPASALGLMAGLLILAPPAQSVGVLVPGLSAQSEAGDINSAGAVVGFTYDDGNGNTRGFLRADGQTTLLGSTEAGTNTYAGEINDAGRIAGEVRQGGAVRATTWDPDGTQQDLHPAGWGESAVVDLNEVGQVLLSHVAPDGGPALAGAVWSPGGQVNILAPWDGGTGVEVEDITDAGLVAGNLWFGESDSRGFVWDPDSGLPQEITPPGGGRFLVAAVNDDAEVAGVLFRPGVEDRAAVWSDGSFTEIPLTDTSFQQVRTISETGTVLVTSDLGAFAWTPGTSLLRIAGLGGGTVTPLAINDAGTVVGSARTVGRGTQAFSWDPVHGTVELGSPQGTSDARALNETGHSVGTSRAGATSWAPTANSPRAPSTPQGVLAAAGDGALLASWSDPVDNGGLWLEYEVVATPAGGGASVSQTVQALKEGSHDATLSGLDNDTDYVVTVLARSSAGSSLPAQAPTSVMPRAGATLPTTLVSGEASPENGGGLNTGGPVTEDEPVSTGVWVPGGTAGGPIVIAEGPVDLTAPTQYSFLGQQVQITAPEASAESPLELTFSLHSSLLAGLDDPLAVQVFRTEDGSTTPVVVPACDQAWSTASPDPCVTDRYYDDPAEGGSGDLYLTVLTSHASAWNFGIATTGEPFDFTGFFAPVDPEPTVNVVRAGRTIPVKFSLGGDRGLDVLGAPASSQQHACEADASADAVETTVSTGGGELTYDPATDQYTYAWKTAKAFAGQCRTFALELSDGSTHTAEFEFR